MCVTKQYPLVISPSGKSWKLKRLTAILQNIKGTSPLKKGWIVPQQSIIILVTLHMLIACLQCCGVSGASHVHTCVAQSMLVAYVCTCTYHRRIIIMPIVHSYDKISIEFTSWLSHHSTQLLFWWNNKICYENRFHNYYRGHLGFPPRNIPSPHIRFDSLRGNASTLPKGGTSDEKKSCRKPQKPLKSV